MVSNGLKLCLNLIVAVNIRLCSSCPTDEVADAKAVYKSGEIQDMGTPITLDKIKLKLKETEIFDEERQNLSEREKKELVKLYNAVEIMATSRSRQPSNVQNMFSSLRLVERAVKKQLKEGQISEQLASKFNWEKLSSMRQKRDKPTYRLDKTKHMRIFNVEA